MVGYPPSLPHFSATDKSILDVRTVCLSHGVIDVRRDIFSKKRF